ncbi:unnamed protein product [Allacma fusca]|uniref:RING-type domain-containing protein n=1 Tax=Allacma fusca TaxID=39272 RepID=A0A8J2JVI0_9HEXA|nr:unnamed protein product [Allacma fusca]
MSTDSFLKNRKARREGEGSKESSEAVPIPTCSADVAFSHTESGDSVSRTVLNDVRKQDSETDHSKKSESEANLSEDLRCSICMDFFIEPTLTDCAHVFCNFCIHCWFENRGSSICPQCRNIVQQVFPSPDLNEKVEKYVMTNLSRELLDERERTKRTRRQDMNFIAHDFPTSSNPDPASVFSNSTADIDELFWTVSMQQQEFPDLSSFWPTIPGYTSFSNSLASPPTRSQTQDETSADEVDETLQQFEYRLDRAQRAYGVLVSAQREMNHQLEHLHSISHRLERYDRLGNSSVTNTGSTPGANDASLMGNVDLRSTNDEFRLGQVHESPQDVSGVDHSYSNNLESSDMWQWLPCTSMSPCSHCYLSRNACYHSPYCSENIRYPNVGSMNEQNRSCGVGRYPTQVIPNYSLGYHDQYPSSSSHAYQQNTPTASTPDRPRPARRRRHSEMYPQNHSGLSIPSPTTPTLEDEYLEELRNQIAENDFAEAIERSLVMDMFEPHYDGHQQISVRSSRVLGPSSQNITSISIETDFLSDLNAQSNCQRCPPRESPASRRHRHSNNGSRQRQNHC